jgi:hypothetical protein
MFYFEVTAVQLKKKEAVFETNRKKEKGVSSFFQITVVVDRPSPTHTHTPFFFCVPSVVY